MQEPMPYYFNKDGTRVNNEAFVTRSRSRQRSQHNDSSVMVRDQNCSPTISLLHKSLEHYK